MKVATAVNRIILKGNRTAAEERKTPFMNEFFCVGS